MSQTRSQPTGRRFMANDVRRDPVRMGVPGWSARADCISFPRESCCANGRSTEPNVLPRKEVEVVTIRSPTVASPYSQKVCPG
jgi:hypothetical protein